ncbi:hypothetical protein J437_LFUL008840 [Ladona fulva]|uniref:C2H2-type domain-containing protein n=1 Tax=Ladona fulva TaxID=123851 RepID=A0A8K0P442_LADFU|nr:hypothetical protein J437_LFUL008840 [Ladona fulva]
MGNDESLDTTKKEILSDVRVHQDPLHSISKESTKEVEVNQKLDLSEDGRDPPLTSSWFKDGICGSINYTEYHKSEIMHNANKPEIKQEPEEAKAREFSFQVNIEEEMEDGTNMGESRNASSKQTHEVYIKVENEDYLECIDDDVPEEKILQARRKDSEKKNIEELRGSDAEESRVLFKPEAIEGGVNVEDYLICHHCGEKRDTKRELRDHIYVVHLSVSMVKEKEEGTSEYNRNRLKCTFCQKSFESKSHLVRHLNVHSGEEQSKFNDFEHSTSLSTNLATDVFKHTGEKLFKCGLCKYRASRKCYLKIHESIHSGGKPYKCTDCNYSTADRSCLTRHIRIHTGEKPFKCNITADRSCLTRHIRIHTGEKPFTCNKCEYRSSRKSSLKVHLRRHDREKLLI